MDFTIPALKILFVCKYGEVRGPIASKLYETEYNTDSMAYWFSNMDKKSEQLEWCDIVIVMSHKVEVLLKKEFPRFRKPMHNLDYPNMYDPPTHLSLKKQLRKRIDPILKKYKWNKEFLEE